MQFPAKIAIDNRRISAAKDTCLGGFFNDDVIFIIDACDFAGPVQHNAGISPGAVFHFSGSGIDDIAVIFFCGFREEILYLVLTQAIVFEAFFEAQSGRPVTGFGNDD